MDSQPRALFVDASASRQVTGGAIAVMPVAEWRRRTAGGVAADFWGLVLAGGRLWHHETYMNTYEFNLVSKVGRPGVVSIGGVGAAFSLGRQVG